MNSREWRCNILRARSHWDHEIDVRVEDEPRMCEETAPYRWWSSLDRYIFAVVNMARIMKVGSYYCPVCESFFSPQGHETPPNLPPPYVRICNTCKQIGTEHEEVYGARKAPSEDP